MIIRLTFSNGYKTHFVTEDLVDVVLQDVIMRGAELESASEETEIGMDAPGMIIADRPLEYFRCCDPFVFYVPSSDVYYILEAFMREKNPREGDWYKIHNYACCLCLSSKHFLTMKKHLFDRLEEADKRYDVFFDRWKTRVEERQAAKAAKEKQERHAEETRLTRSNQPN